MALLPTVVRWIVMELDLRDKVAIVTGASTGIGRATALLFADEGVQVVGLSRRPPDEMRARIEHYVADLEDPDVPAESIEKIVAKYDRLDVLVNNAAVYWPGTHFIDESEEAWMKMLNLNLMAAVRMTRAALPHLEATGGCIVNVTTVNSRVPSPSTPAYSASKAALLNMSKAVGIEYVNRGIRVVTVSPGLTATPIWLGAGGAAQMIADRDHLDVEVVTKDVAASTPANRYLSADEVARVIVFLASPVASGVTGAEVVVDAGLTPMM